MKNLLFFSWILFLGSLFIFIHDLTNQEVIERFDMYNLRATEAGLMLIFSIISAENYIRVIKSTSVHILTGFLLFVFFTSWIHEFSSIFLTTVHTMCYLYMFVILVIITVKKIRVATTV